MSEEAPVRLSDACKDILEPVTMELTISENEKIRFVDIGGKLLKAGYEMETKKTTETGPSSTSNENCASRKDS
jgi:hypothetical protein